LPPTGGFLDIRPDTGASPSWLSEQDLAYIAAEYRRTGFRGGLNLYRAIDQNWELLAPWQGATISQPALFIAGSRDAIINTPGGRASLAAMPSVVPNLRRTLLIEGAGHYIQQERPEQVNAALVEFLRTLPG
jgi:pimeloyl-ACP methyl ester carboxylesterase